jgi:general secretion pathway protein F
MKTFSYRGYARDGARARGMVEALDLKDAREKLAARGILTEFVEPASGTRVGRRGQIHFDGYRRAAFYRELAALARAGVPMVAALDLLLETQPEARHAPTLAELRDRIREGASPADALRHAIPNAAGFEIALFEAGQRSGRLGEVLDHLAAYLEEERRIHESIQSAVIYPSFVIALALAIGTVMVLVIFPRLGALFNESGVELPALTRFLIWLGQEGQLVAVFCLALPVALFWWGRVIWTRPGSRLVLERRLARWPVIGSGMRLAAASRFARTLGLLIQGGVPLVDALPLAGRACGNRSLEIAVQQGTVDVRHGQSVVSMLAGCPLIGDLFPPWYRAGEAAGDLPGLLAQAAHRFQTQWETLVHRAVRLIEPTMIVIVGVFVLLVALGILLPVLALNRTSF